MLPTEIVPFLESGLSTLVGTCDRDLRPLCARGIGLVVLDGGRAARVFLPERCSAELLRNLRDNGRIAVTVSRPMTHRTVQVKGEVRCVELAPAEDRAVVEALFCGFLRETSLIGLPAATTLRMHRWPAYRLDFTARQVFIQTPGPRAGTELGPEDLA